jgi:dCMP deaminase
MDNMSEEQTTKREDCLSWDGMFMGQAAVASMRSKDPSTQNGACVVDLDTKRILTIGYNGFPKGCSDDDFPWARTAEKEEDTKYPYVEHAERNAIYLAANNGIRLAGSAMYIYSEKGYYPCDSCARAIIQSGIVMVTMAFGIKGNTDVYNWEPTKRMFEAADVNLRILSGSNSTEWVGQGCEPIIDDFNLLSSKLKTVKENLQDN